VTGAPIPTWTSRAQLADKFNKHGRRLGIRDIHAYEVNSLDTVRRGVRFTYEDRFTSEPRIGYFDPITGRFTAVTEDDTEIVNHFRAREGYVRNLPASDYV
jgi:hypothetical protein